MKLKEVIESDASDKAHKAGLVSKGGAAWADKSGKTVAVTKKGKLVSIDKKGMDTLKSKAKTKMKATGEPDDDTTTLNDFSGRAHDWLDVDPEEWKGLDHEEKIDIVQHDSGLMDALADKGVDTAILTPENVSAMVDNIDTYYGEEDDREETKPEQHEKNAEAHYMKALKTITDTPGFSNGSPEDQEKIVYDYMTKEFMPNVKDDEFQYGARAANRLRGQLTNNWRADDAGDLVAKIWLKANPRNPDRVSGI